jgi:hypothetical protein
MVFYMDNYKIQPKRNINILICQYVIRAIKDKDNFCKIKYRAWLFLVSIFSNFQSNFGC